MFLFLVVRLLVAYTIAGTVEPAVAAELVTTCFKRCYHDDAIRCYCYSLAHTLWIEFTRKKAPLVT